MALQRKVYLYARDEKVISRINEKRENRGHKMHENVHAMNDLATIAQECEVIFPIVPLIISRLLQTRRPTTQKLSAYECGVEPVGRAWVQFKASYFLYALVFVVFDVETVFLYPWAVQFRSLGLFAVIEMLIFMAILLIGLAYAWKKGALEWES